MDFQFASMEILRLKARYSILLYFYVLMPNHFHFLLESMKKGGIAGFMHDFSLFYAKYFRHVYQGTGHVWQGRYKEKLIKKDSYLIQCGKYIEDNPVRARLVERAELYQWSSARAHILSCPDPLVDPCPYVTL